MPRLPNKIEKAHDVAYSSATPNMTDEPQNMTKPLYQILRKRDNDLRLGI